MNYKKSLLVFCLIICILFSISSAVASDVNDTAIASDDTIKQEDLTLPVEEATPETTANENNEISDDALGIEESEENTPNIDNNNENAIGSADITNDQPVSTSKNDDNNVLSADNAKKYEVTFYKQTGKYTTDKKVYFKVTDAKTGAPVKIYGLEIGAYEYKTGDYVASKLVNTNSKGIGVYNCEGETLWDGTYSFKAGVSKTNIDNIDDLTSNIAQKKIVIYKNHAKITAAKKIKVPKKSKKKFVIKVKGQDKKPLKGVIVKVVIYTGNKHTTKYLVTNSKGIVTYKVSKLSQGTHKVKLSLDDDWFMNNNGIYGKTVTSYIIVGKASAITKTVSKKSTANSKAALKIIAPKVTKYYKKSGKFVVTVKNKASNKAVKGIKVIVKVYTGSKVKKYAAKTNAKGKVSISTKSLSKGKHKVVVTAKGNSKYKKASSKSSIKIVKKAKTSGKNTGDNTGGTYIYRYYAGQVVNPKENTNTAPMYDPNLYPNLNH